MVKNLVKTNCQKSGHADHVLKTPLYVWPLQNNWPHPRTKNNRSAQPVQYLMTQKATILYGKKAILKHQSNKKSTEKPPGIFSEFIQNT